MYSLVFIFFLNREFNSLNSVASNGGTDKGIVNGTGVHDEEDDDLEDEEDAAGAMRTKGHLAFVKKWNAAAEEKMVDLVGGIC